MDKNLSKIFLTLAVICSFGVQVRAESLVYCSYGSPSGFDPAISGSSIDFEASSQTIFDRLVDTGAGTYLAPSLAERWDVSGDGLEYTFHLRKGVKFHQTRYFGPTRDFNADDVIFSLNRQLEENHPYRQVYSDYRYTYSEAKSLSEIIKDIIKIDDFKVKFVLNRPANSLLATLSMDFASIHSAEYANQLLEIGNPISLINRPIGTGPFKFQSYQSDAFITFLAHEDYWSGKPHFEKLIFAITPDKGAQLQKLKAGECDIIPLFFDENFIHEIKSRGDFQTVSFVQPNISYLAYNTKKHPFDDPKVRKALDMAINKKAILSSVFNESKVVANSPISPSMWFYPGLVEEDVYDPSEAVKVLESKNLQHLNIEIQVPYGRYIDRRAERVAQHIKADWEKIGISVEIINPQWAEYLNNSNDIERNNVVLVNDYADSSDPYEFLSRLLGCNASRSTNFANWCNEAFDNLVETAAHGLNFEEQRAKYRKAISIFKEQVPWTTISHSVSGFAYRNEQVCSFQHNAVGVRSFYFCSPGISSSPIQMDSIEGFCPNCGISGPETCSKNACAQGYVCCNGVCKKSCN